MGAQPHMAWYIHLMQILKHPVYPSPALGTLVYSNFHCSLILGGEVGEEEKNKN